MASHTEIQRVAAAMHVLRPSWRTDSLVTYLSKHHADRPYADLAIAAVVVCLDERTNTPVLLSQQGPWWQAAYVGGQKPTPSIGPGSEPRCERDGHECYAARNCAACRSELLAGEAS
jgi:hypothetical protein